MLYFYIFLFSLLIILLLILLGKKYPIIMLSQSNEVRRIHTVQMLKIGGVSFLSLLFLYYYIDDHIYLIILFTSYIFLIFGLISDFYENFSPYIRLLLFLIVTSAFIFNTKIEIDNVSIDFINNFLLSNYFFSFLFTAVCIILATNSFNIIDGNHGLLLGFSIITIITINQHAYNHFIGESVLLNSLLIAILALFIFNFIFGKVLSGDTGAYFLGFIISSIVIDLANNNLLEPFQAACILFYPITETVVSFSRRVFILRKHAFYPDNLHLHSLIYNLLITRLPYKNMINLGFHNRICSFSILFIISTLSLFSVNLGDEIGFGNLFLIFIFIYLLIYLILLRAAR